MFASLTLVYRQLMWHRTNWFCGFKVPIKNILACQLRRFYSQVPALSISKIDCLQRPIHMLIHIAVKKIKLMDLK